MITTLNSNPSSWQHRIFPVILSTVGFCIAIYLSFFQMHIIHSVWDPFFGDETKKVLTSALSQKFPIPDALLGAIGYLFDLILASIGKIDRWRSQSYIVLLFGIVVSLLALTSIFLAVVQIFFIHAICTLCLSSAIISIIIAILARPEVSASIKFLQNVKKENGSFSKAFFGSK